MRMGSIVLRERILLTRAHGVGAWYTWFNFVFQHLKIALETDLQKKSALNWTLQAPGDGQYHFIGGRLNLELWANWRAGAFLLYILSFGFGILIVDLDIVSSPSAKAFHSVTLRCFKAWQIESLNSLRGLVSCLEGFDTSFSVVKVVLNDIVDSSNTYLSFLSYYLNNHFFTIANKSINSRFQQMTWSVDWISTLGFITHTCSDNFRPINLTINIHATCPVLCQNSTNYCTWVTPSATKNSMTVRYSSKVQSSRGLAIENWRFLSYIWHKIIEQLIRVRPKVTIEHPWRDGTDSMIVVKIRKHVSLFIEWRSSLYERSHHRVFVDLGMKKVPAKWIPKHLNADQKRVRVETWRSVYVWLENDADFFSRADTMVHFYHSGTKREMIEWKHAGSPRPKEFRI